MNINVSGLTGGYKKGFKLKDINFSAPTGSFTGLIGPNGSGKSTLLKMIAGILKPESGEIKAGGLSIPEISAGRRSRIISYLPPASPSLFPFTVFETVLMGRNPWQGKFSPETRQDREEALKAMKLVGIEFFRDRLVSSLSTGEKQKVLLARTICQQSSVMLMDEPVSHLDIHHIRQVFYLLRKINNTGVTVIAALHDINLVTAYCGRVAVLRDGIMVESGSHPSKVINKSFLENIYGKGIRVEEVGGKKYVFP